MEGVRSGTSCPHSYWTKLNTLKVGVPLSFTASVANRGDRSAYFKAANFKGGPNGYTCMWSGIVWAKHWIRLCHFISSDLACKHLTQAGIIKVDPCQMVLPAGFKQVIIHHSSYLFQTWYSKLLPLCLQEVKVTVTPSEQEVVRCLREANIVSCLAFFCGDEVSRIKYRKCVSFSVYLILPASLMHIHLSSGP